ncbi:Metallo-beta-lactamase family protein, RNA-specific (modular protein) [Burkholderiales bacterium]|nr:Metallo-beta-lactamase family protein, RNA-specific (modular protein) [Burkholderiales bacterium]
MAPQQRHPAVSGPDPRAGGAGAAVRIAFHGANRTVTGSCHLVECAGIRVLVDCGLAQGGRETEARNREPFGFAPADVDFVLLTHAHLDHCGRLPLLAKRGFQGEIVATAATRELARVVMLDAAHLQEEEGRRNARRSPHRRPHDEEGAAEAEPLYTALDALNCLDRFGRSASYGQAMQLAPGVRVTFLDAGHILGSASLYLELEEHGRRQTVAFSGDLGNQGRPLLRSPVVPPPSDIAVMETTYGDRLHKPIGPSIEEFYEAVTGAFARGGNVVIPTFALERAQAAGPGRRAPAATRASVSRFPNGDFGHADLRAPSGVFRSAHCAAVRRGQRPVRTARAALHARCHREHGNQPVSQRRDHPGRRRHVQRRPGAPPPAPEPVARELRGHLCRLRCPWHACPAHHRRGPQRAHLRRGGTRARQRSHDQRLFGARRPRRAARLAASGPAQAHVSRARRGGRDAGLCRAAARHARRDARVRSVLRNLTLAAGRSGERVGLAPVERC